MTPSWAPNDRLAKRRFGMQALYELVAEIGEALKARGEKIAVNESS